MVSIRPVVIVCASLACLAFSRATISATTATPSTITASAVDTSVMTFELNRRLFIKLSEHCQQPLAMPDVDIAEMTMLMKDKVGISYLQYADQLFTPEQIRAAADQEFQQWRRQYSDCKAVAFKIAYRSAQKQVSEAVDVLRAMPTRK